MRHMIPLKSEAGLLAEYEERCREACTRRVPLAVVLLAAYVCLNLLCAGLVIYAVDQESDTSGGRTEQPDQVSW